jgi:hypothetical protein
MLGRMAGGMNRRGRTPYGSIAERIAATRGVQLAPVEPTPLERLRHCWVSDERGRRPALLLEWRQGNDGWEARVVVPVLIADAWVPREEWLPADQLDQA